MQARLSLTPQKGAPRILSPTDTKPQVIDKHLTTTARILKIVDYISAWNGLTYVKSFVKYTTRPFYGLLVYNL